jgi:uncharacterized protein with ParB-like and HNH nuclease domain
VIPRIAKVNDFTSGSNMYKIPVFQRDYEWDKEKWFYFWQDIKALYVSSQYKIKNDPQINLSQTLDTTHFIGTVLTRSTRTLGHGLGSEFLLIDGQQRLVTLFIIMSAIRDHQLGINKEVGSDDPLAVIRSREVSFPRFQVNKNDESVYEKIVTGFLKDELPQSVVESKLGRAYLYFRWQLWKGIDETSTEDVQVDNTIPPKFRKTKSSNFTEGQFLQYWPSIQKNSQYDLSLLENCISSGLSMLEVTLQPNDEEDAIVFETLNARNTELEKFDLIRNNFFLRLGTSAMEFFEHNWRYFDKQLKESSKKNGFKRDQYIYDFLIFSGIEKISYPKLYTKWIEYVRKKLGPLGEGNDGEYFREELALPLIRSLSLYEPSFGKTSTLKINENEKIIPPKVKNILAENYKLSSTLVPLHMIALNEWHLGKLSDKDLYSWIKKLQSYVLRIIISGGKLNNLRAFVLANGPRIAKDPNLIKLTEILTTSQISNNQLKNLITNSQFANDSNSVSVSIILRGIERNMHENPANAHPVQTGIGELDWNVEHIYPQSTNDPGKDWLKDITSWSIPKDSYVDFIFTLGNVTLLSGSDNKSIQRASFSRKKEAYEKSGLKISQDMLRKQKWTPKEIKDRSSFLLSYFCDEWPE